MQPLIHAAITASYPGRPQILHNVEIQIEPGEILGLAGESGSGKSTLGLALIGLLRWRGANVAGRLSFDGRDLLTASEREWRAVRGKEIALVLQNPLASLNPSLTIGTQMREAWTAHAGGSKPEIHAKLKHALESVNLPGGDDFLKRYPRQLSVGMAQRVVIAMAMLHKPRLLIADEPTSALDVVNASEVLNLFSTLNRENGTAILFISHDLLSVAKLCSRAIVLCRGQVVETGTVQQLFRNPKDRYTQTLIQALPANPFNVEAEPVAHF